MSDKKGIADVLNAYKEKDDAKNEFDWSKLTRNICIIFLVITVCYKIIFVEIDKSVDLATLLSLALALFSIFISFQFYFKTTETSNKFYDNTYKFTKEISEILVKIESGFGEKLTSIQNIQTMYKKEAEIQSDIKEKEKKLDEDILENKKELEEMIKKVLEKNGVNEEENKKIWERFKKIEEEEEFLRKRMDSLNRIRTNLVRDDRPSNFTRIKNSLSNFTKSDIVPGIIEKDSTTFEEQINTFMELYPKGGAYENDLYLLGLINANGLTVRGKIWLEKMIKDMQQDL